MLQFTAILSPFIAIMKKNIKYLLLLISLALYSCSNSPVQSPAVNETLLFQKSGLVDSAYVTCCCTSVKRSFSDTLNLTGYNKIKIQFNGYTNSDGSDVDIFYNTETHSNIQVYTVNDPDSLNGDHSIQIPIPSEKVILELRTIIFPPVCGENELKYTRSRDFKIYGIK